MFKPYRPRVGLVVFLLLASVVICAAVPISVLIFFPKAEESVWPMISAFGVMALGIVIAVRQVYRYARKTRSAYFDQTFLPLGLSGSPYLMTGRQYHGVVQGRGVHVYLHSTQRHRPMMAQDGGASVTVYTGDRMEIMVDAPFKTRVSVSTKHYRAAMPTDRILVPIVAKALRSAMSAAGGEQASDIAIDDPFYQDFAVVGLDAEWTRRFLVLPMVKEAFGGLLGIRANVGFTAVNILPEAVRFNVVIPINRICPETIEAVLESLLAIADAAGEVGRPMHPAEETDAERLFRVDRNSLHRRYRWIVWLVIAALVGIPVVVMIVLGLFLSS